MSAVQAPPALEPGWLTEVRLRAWRRMLWCRELWARNRYADEGSLAITHSEVERALAATAGLQAAEREFQAADVQAQRLTAEIEALRDSVGADARWERMCELLGLQPGERQLLALVLTAELVPGMRRVYGYLQDATAPLDATTALVADLWGYAAAPRLTAGSALLTWALARPADGLAELSSSTTGWVADPQLLDHLLGEPAPEPVAPPAAPRLHPREVDDIVRFVEGLQAPDGSAPAVEIELVAPAGAGRTAVAAQAMRPGSDAASWRSTAPALAARPDAVTSPPPARHATRCSPARWRCGAERSS